jgi:hypothetical protein
MARHSPCVRLPATMAPDGSLLRCSFCSKSQGEVDVLLEGPEVWICDECVDVCSQLLGRGPGRWLGDTGRVTWQGLKALALGRAKPLA